jgi:uncharacterized protein YjbI with pentapeptide repeats
VAVGNWQQRARLWLQRRWPRVKRWLRRELSKILIVAITAVVLATLTALLWPTIQSTVGPGTDRLTWFGAAALAAVAFGVIGALVYGVAKKSLWQLLELLVIPLALTAISLWFTQEQEARQRHQQIQDAKQAREIEEQRAQDAALQAYLDQMSSLLLEKNLRNAEDNSEVRTLARARTLTVLSRLDPRRRSRVLQFLIEASLVQGSGDKTPIIELNGANLQELSVVSKAGTDTNLSKANLEGANLRGATLFGVNLSGSNLSGAILEGARLSGTTLDDADLSGASLNGASLTFVSAYGTDFSVAKLNSIDTNEVVFRGTDLSGAELKRAKLAFTYFDGANLLDANLSNASIGELVTFQNADLSYANLSNTGLSNKQLAQATTLEGATMPDGRTLKGDSVFPASKLTFEDWLKSKENSGPS